MLKIAGLLLIINRFGDLPIAWGVAAHRHGCYYPSAGQITYLANHVCLCGVILIFLKVFNGKPLVIKSFVLTL